MADRTSAEVFGMMFEFLAEDPREQHKAFARKLWEKSNHYDFNPYQMYCDDALVALGLARLGLDPDCPEEGEMMLYGPEVKS